MVKQILNYYSNTNKNDKKKNQRLHRIKNHYDKCRDFPVDV